MNKYRIFSISIIAISLLLLVGAIVYSKYNYILVPKPIINQKLILNKFDKKYLVLKSNCALVRLNNGSPDNLWNLQNYSGNLSNVLSINKIEYKTLSLKPETLDVYIQELEEQSGSLEFACFNENKIIVNSIKINFNIKNNSIL